MTDDDVMNEERRNLAAEFALGVLTGAERDEARRLMASNPQFRAEVADWKGRLAPLLDEIAPVAAPRELWRKIESGLPERRDNGGDSGGNVVTLKRRIRVWQGIAGAAAALAASLALVAIVPRETTAPLPTPAERPAPSPMVAMVGGDQRDMTLVASWDPANRRLVLAVAGDMPEDLGRAHELWVIPVGGQPRSLGVMAEQRASHMELAEAIAELMRQGATIAISVEPQGGSPTGQPSGPVIASGTLEPT